jgi:uncharacterized cupredoxin-like copper-binding protein
MQRKYMKPTLTAALLLALAAPPALAHGDTHQPRPAFDPSGAEQKEFGIAGDPKQARRTVRIEMSDAMRFKPHEIVVKRGETIRFVVANRGRLRHEMVIGTAQDLRQHAELMRKFPNMQHDEPFMAHVAPGGSERMVWTFNRPGTFEFGCLVGGHFEAGMTGRIRVLESARPAPSQAGLAQPRKGGA